MLFENWFFNHSINFQKGAGWINIKIKRRSKREQCFNRRQELAALWVWLDRTWRKFQTLAELPGCCKAQIIAIHHKDACVIAVPPGITTLYPLISSPKSPFCYVQEFWFWLQTVWCSVKLNWTNSKFN